MNIFIVARGWPSKREPQWGCFERDQAVALRNLGHKVVVLSVDTRFRRYHRKYGITRDVHSDISHYDLFASSLFGKVLRKVSVRLSTIVKRRIFLYLFNNVIKKEGMPDVVYAHYLGNCSMALAAKIKYGIPVVGIEHWSELGYENINNKIKYWAQNTYKDLDLLLTVSSALQKNIKKNFGVDSEVVNNMVGQEFLETSVNKVMLKNDDSFRFIAVGNLLPVKGYDVLIKAFSKSGLANDGCTLTIVGEGKERENLENLIKEAGLEDTITLPGRKHRDEIIRMLGESNVFVLSSRTETFGVACIEALSQGLPAIATRCGGTEDIINRKNGILVDADDINALTGALRQMHLHNSEYDPDNIAKDCRERFAPEVIAKQLSELLGGGKIVFVTVGNLIPRKGLNYLIEAFHRASLSDDVWELGIVGDGPERERLQRMIEEYGFEDNIKLLGAQDRKGVIETLKNSDVFVLSSLSETFGVVVIEALACGLPVIVTDCGGTQDIITEKIGLMCPVKDADKMAECINYMISHYGEYNREDIINDCRSRFSSEAIGKQLEGIFEEVIKEK